MQPEITDWYMLFFDHTDGMRMYQHLRGQGLAARISPAPRLASVCCGMSLLVTDKDIGLVRQAAAASGIAYDRIVPLPRQIDPQRDVYC